MNPKVLIDGENVAQVPVDDRALWYGDGVFETILLRQGGLPLWRWHWQRLSQACAHLGLPVPDQAKLVDEVRQVGGHDAVVRVLISRGSGQRGYAPLGDGRRIVSAHPLPSFKARPLSTILCQLRWSHQPALAGLKHVGRLEQVLARDEVNRAGADEGLMLDQDQQLIGATSANVFLYQDQQWWTPRLHRCGVAGVMRAAILDLLPITVTDLALARLDRADSVFLCNSIRGIMPVTRIVDVNDDLNLEPVQELHALISKHLEGV